MLVELTPHDLVPPRWQRARCTMQSRESKGSGTEVGERGQVLCKAGWRAMLTARGITWGVREGGREGMGSMKRRRKRLRRQLGGSKNGGGATGFSFLRLTS